MLEVLHESFISRYCDWFEKVRRGDGHGMASNTFSLDFSEELFFAKQIHQNNKIKQKFILRRNTILKTLIKFESLSWNVEAYITAIDRFISCNL